MLQDMRWTQYELAEMLKQLREAHASEDKVNEPHQHDNAHPKVQPEKASEVENPDSTKHETTQQ